jgi:UDP-GlcNAc:undecaprenyl-phosphate GlcNAc-1-phosphate transferase
LQEIPTVRGQTGVGEVSESPAVQSARQRPSTVLIRLLQLLLFGSGVVWACTGSGGHLDQMQVPGFLLALSVSWWLTPEIRARAMRLGLVDKPGEERRIHKVAVPRLGGVALYISIIVSLVVCMAIGGRWPKEGGLAGIAAGGTLIFVLGLLDDLESIPAKIKFLVQILAACAAYSLGVRIQKQFFVPFSLDFLTFLPFIHSPNVIDLGPLAIVVTVFWLVGIANAVNLIDGMDGLAAGVSAISAVAIWAVAMSVVPGTHPNPAPYPALIAAVLAGALVGFLRWNFNPARIFLGDSGAYLSGFVLGCLAVTGVMKKSTALLTIGLPLLILFFPLLDTAMAIIRRLAKKQSPFTPDAEHIHHRLLRTGLSQKNVAYVIYTGSALLGLLATWVVGMPATVAYLQILGCIVVMALLFSEVLNRHRQRKGNLPLPDEPQDTPS